MGSIGACGGQGEYNGQVGGEGVDWAQEGTGLMALVPIPLPRCERAPDMELLKHASLAGADLSSSIEQAGTLPRIF